MDILILSITINWIYRLYEEYITSFKKFIYKYYNKYNINIDIIYLNNTDFNINSITTLNIVKYDKILYSGDISIFNNIYTMFNNIYYINIEQLSKKSYYTMLTNIDKSIKIIDYSEENLLYLKDTYESYLFPPYFNYFNINMCEKNIDVFSITNNTYRQNIFNQILLNKKYQKSCLENIYGYDRDNIFNKTKIYINIHCSDEHLTMELIRITNLIMRKVIVVTQKSVNTDILFFKEHIIIFNDINDLNYIINDILENYNCYYNTLFKNFEKKIDDYNNYIKTNLDKILF